MKDECTLLSEAVVVGFLLTIIFAFLKLAITNPLVCAFLAGALFHIICEYTGVNEWYVKNY